MTQMVNFMRTKVLVVEAERYWVLLQVVLASCVIALCAQIQIPLYPVPVTGQTFGVMLVAAFLGSRKALMATLLYLIEGSFGYPVFAGGSGGFYHLLGPTGGYLISYPLAAYCFGWLLERKKHSVWDGMVAVVVVPWVQLGMGAAWLALFVGFDKAFSSGFYPFVFLGPAKAFFVYSLVKIRRSV